MAMLPKTLMVVVWGYDPKGICAESPDLEITLHGDEPEDEKIAVIVASAIDTIAEVRRLQGDEEVEEDSQPEEGLAMTRQGRQTPRKPATKFAHLRKKMEKNRIAAKISKKKGDRRP